MNAKARIDSNATHVSAIVAFAPNGAKLKDAFEWLSVETEADMLTIFAAARRKASRFMSVEQAETSTLFIVEITQQWNALGFAI